MPFSVNERSVWGGHLPPFKLFIVPAKKQNSLRRRNKKRDQKDKKSLRELLSSVKTFGFPIENFGNDKKEKPSIPFLFPSPWREKKYKVKASFPPSPSPLNGFCEGSKL